MHQDLKPSDLIFVLGSNDVRVADRAAELYLHGYAPIVVCAGGNGKDSSLTETEAKVFSERMILLGVPADKILLEPSSTNTGENVLFTQKLLKEKGILVKNIIAVQKPYMERRTFATISKQWPEVYVQVTSPSISYEEYSVNEDFKNRFINVMVGDLQRIKIFPEKGFQIPQEIPDLVWNAYEQLVKLGYNRYVIKD